MEVDGLPRVERSGRGLCVRVEGPVRDLPVGNDGTVEPATGGMSVALDAPRNLPKPRLPRSLGGEGRDPVFTMFTARVPVALLVRVDCYPHALIEPGSRCPLSHFEADLAATRTLWSKAGD
jgi:hypothetical protein